MHLKNVRRTTLKEVFKLLLGEFGDRKLLLSDVTGGGAKYDLGMIAECEGIQIWWRVPKLTAKEE